jgi:lysozyme
MSKKEPKTTKQVQEIIKHYEGLKLKAYICAGNVPTIGYGHTGTITAKMVRDGFTITKQRAEELFLIDLLRMESFADKLIEVPVSNNEYSAIVSLIFNIGPGSAKTPRRGFYWSSLRKHLNNKERAKAANAFLNHVYAAGKKLKGLVKRRTTEMDIFSTPDALPTKQYVLPELDPAELELMQSMRFDIPEELTPVPVIKRSPLGGEE